MKRLRKKIVAASLGTAACALSAFALLAAGEIWAASANEAPPVQLGLWEVTTKVQLPKLPLGMSIPRGLPLPQSGSRRFCVAKEDIENPQALVKAQTGCELLDWQRSGTGEVTWKTSCQGQVPSTGNGRMSVAGSTLQGSGTVTARVEGFSLPIRMSYTGQRLSECP